MNQESVDDFLISKEEWCRGRTKKQLDILKNLNLNIDGYTRHITNCQLGRMHTPILSKLDKTDSINFMTHKYSLTVIIKDICITDTGQYISYFCLNEMSDEEIHLYLREHYIQTYDFKIVQENIDKISVDHMTRNNFLSRGFASLRLLYKEIKL